MHSLNFNEYDFHLFARSKTSTASVSAPTFLTLFSPILHSVFDKDSTQQTTARPEAAPLPPAVGAHYTTDNAGGPSCEDDAQFFRVSLEQRVAFKWA